MLPLSSAPNLVGQHIMLLLMLVRHACRLIRRWVSYCRYCRVARRQCRREPTAPADQAGRHQLDRCQAIKMEPSRAVDRVISFSWRAIKKRSKWVNLPRRYLRLATNCTAFLPFSAAFCNGFCSVSPTTAGDRETTRHSKPQATINGLTTATVYRTVSA
ncbi:hypothetical protein THAOC_37809 [Thalassiosira oceanica]|uniref:Secreted protein n=1 Tax=Thalassiosira oceanica TaxID=159749 RepID=K0QZL8_THAOC|nr:hypothetical protein THAOC_37809 [Thalassiosira oceanica]|eukprot:EJK43719.1 hypothetical protein THAOC_37809 [Thalassiosira oceanica]